MKKELHILFNQEIVDKYKDYYFKKYPKRTKLDISPTCLSLNKFTAMIRIMQAAEKIKYAEFCQWVLEYYNVPKLNLTKCKLTLKYQWKDKRRRDYDNFACISLKYNMDQMVKYGLLIDDNFDVVTGIDLRMEYIKSESSSMEFIFEYDDDIN